MSAFAKCSVSFVCTPWRLNSPKRATVSCRRRLPKWRAALLPSKVSVGIGSVLLSAALINRLFFTPMLPNAQSRSDILCVIACGSLILYGLGRVDIAERKSAVEMGGVFTRRIAEGDRKLETFLQMLLEGVQSVKSVAVVRNDAESGTDASCVGLFEEEQPDIRVQSVMKDVWEKKEGRVYMADMNIVPVRRSEFGFLPEQCQAVLVQKVSNNTAVLIAAEQKRPFTGTDFGWIQAICDRMAGAESDG